MVLTREGNSERAMDLRSRLLQDRIIRVSGEVTGDMADIIVDSMLFLESEDPTKDIMMYINSPGGSVSAGMAIYDTMQYIKPDVSTIVAGLAASMGSVLLMGGAKGKRFALPHAEIMIHQPSAGCEGKVSDMERSFQHSLDIKAMMHKLYAKHTGQSEEKIARDMDRDNWMTPQEAVDYGLIDAIQHSHE